MHGRPPRWEDDEYYLKVIGARAKTLTPAKVRRIRQLEALGWDLEKVAEDVDALNVTQVRNVIIGRTYTRIR